MAAVLGPPRRKWVRGVDASAGPATRALIRADRLVHIPNDPGLAARGLDTTALPGPLLGAATDVLHLITDLLSPSGRDLLP